MNKQSRSLTLHRDTLHRLTAQEISQAVGGHHAASGRHGCIIATQACVHTRQGFTCRGGSLNVPCWPVD